MQTYVFLDLDDTIFQTRGKCPPDEASSLIPAAFHRDGNPLSFMSARQRQLFEWLSASATVIPVTARSESAYRRVRLPFHHAAILDFGGVVLLPTGQLDKQWDQKIRPIMLPDVPPSSVAVTKSPHIGMNVSRTPAAMPGPASGMVTCRKVRTRLAPRSLLASRI